MATAVQNKLYKYSVNGQQYFEAGPVLPTGGGHQEATVDEFNQWYNSNPNMQTWAKQWMGNKTIDQLLAGPSGYEISDQGVFQATQTPEQIAQQKMYDDGVANGTWKKVPVGSGFGYVPTGSAADLQLQGKTYEQQMATPSVQQQIQQQGLQPVNPQQVMQDRTVPVSVNPSTTTNTNQLTQTPVTGSDINSLLSQMQQFQQRVTGAQAVVDNLDNNYQAGFNKIEDERIPMKSLVGQQASLQRQYLQQRNSAVMDLTRLQDQMQFLQTQADKGAATQLQMQKLQADQQAEALRTAIELNIKTPFFNVGGTIYSTASGQPFTSEADFLQKNGMSIGDAVAKNMVQTVDPVAVAAAKRGPGRSGPGSDPDSTSFTDTQLNKGAGKAGMDIEDFTQLPHNEQNYFINGVGSSLENGRLTQDDFDGITEELDDMMADEMSIDDILAFLLQIGIPAEDRYDLEDYVRNNFPTKKGGLLNTGLWSSSQGDKWYNPLGWFN